MLKGKRILITGGTGSFGRKFVEMVLRDHEPERLIIFSRDELKQFEMNQVFSDEEHECLRYFVGDVRDRERLYRACRGVDYIVHAAAMKQVPACEYNPTEAIKTNIYGAQNIINVAADLGIKKVVALSTDKAVSPVNLYGATKLASDKLFVAANAFATGPKFSVVRYGNVLGSRGSVVPFFLKKRTEGVLPITDMRMTRFWIALEEAVELVLHAIDDSSGGEIYIPRIPSMRIADLARVICPECALKEVGIRPGEKLHECLIPREEARNSVRCKSGYIVLPDSAVLKYKGDRSVFEPLAEDFQYSSDSNDWWLSDEDMKAELRKQGYAV